MNKKDIRNSSIAWTIVWWLVGIERVISNESFYVVSTASSIQWIQTFVIALVSISLYWAATKITEKIISESVTKILTGWSIWLSSWVLNYQLQADRWWSFAESIVMVWLSSAGIIAHEYEVPEKIFSKASSIYKNLKLQLWK